MSDPDLLSAIESGRIPVGSLWRNKENSISTPAKKGDWEWYHPTERAWRIGPTFRDCCQHLLANPQ